MSCWGCINDLSEPTWTTEILFMTSLITNHLKTKLKIFSVTVKQSVVAALKALSPATRSSFPDVPLTPTVKKAVWGSYKTNRKN